MPRMPTRSRVPKSAQALLIIDVINPMDFAGGQAFAARARRKALAIARLASRARKGGVPVFFVNDNMGRWQSDIDGLIDYVRDRTPGAALIEVLTPQKGDFVILKPSLSGFFQTALETMLRLGGVKTVILAGFATDACVFLTAADAYMRDFRIVVARDCVASPQAAAHRRALRKIAELLKARVQPSSKIAFRR
jgi:nicotinamidase-related amidase